MSIEIYSKNSLNELNITIKDLVFLERIDKLTTICGKKNRVETIVFAILALEELKKINNLLKNE